VRSLHIVLFQPEIPQNAGNVARSAAAAGAKLHLIEPLGFFLGDRHLRRAGLEYWDRLDVSLHRNLDELMAANPGALFAFLTKKAARPYTEIEWSGNVFLVFGRESTGLPDEILEANQDRCYRIPTRPDVRSLNLAAAAAVVLFDVLRRAGFPGTGEPKDRPLTGTLASVRGGGVEGAKPVDD
jgi:tRNA (cytidine/uridine-2'-O-)-methyltransferase